MKNAVSIVPGNSSTTVTTSGNNVVVAGVKGDTGPQGNQGPQGVQGIQGIQGPPGPSGLYTAVISTLSSSFPFVQRPSGWIDSLMRTATGSLTILTTDRTFLNYPVCQCGIVGGGAWTCAATPHGTPGPTGIPISFFWDRKIDIFTFTTSAADATFSISCSAQN